MGHWVLRDQRTTDGGEHANKIDPLGYEDRNDETNDNRRME